MADLETYDYPQDHNFVRWGSRALGIKQPALAVNCVPGEWVEHKYQEPPGKGMLVANGDDFITILWSIPPGHPATDPDVQYFRDKLYKALNIPTELRLAPKKLDLKYNPLDVQEDIYIPVRLQPNERKRLKK